MRTEARLQDPRPQGCSHRSAILLLSVCGLAACGGRVVGWPADCVDCTDDTSASSTDDTGTVANLPPRVLWTSPEDERVEVAPNTTVLVNFNEPMDPDSITSSTFTLSGGGDSIEGEITRQGETATFAPLVSLDFDTEYTATVTAGVTDAAGLAMEADYVWTFTTSGDTDIDPPQITLTSPADLEVAVLLSAKVRAAFNEPMESGTLTDSSFFVMEGTNLLPGAVSYNEGTLVGTFSPDDALLADTEYVATVTTDVTDLAGNHMSEDYSWTFWTGGEDSDWVPVDLGSLIDFVAVSGAGLTNSNSSGFTTLNGDVGLSPTATCLGDGAPCTITNPIINGTLYANDADGIAAQAKVDLTAAYIDAMARPVGTIVEDLSEMVLAPGVYTSDSTMSLAVGGTLTLDAEGDANAVWIFQIGSSLTVNNSAQVLLINGAQAKNVFWAAFASSTLGSDVSFQGTILAGASNSMGTDSTVVGRLLCTTGEITLLSNTVTLPPL